MGSRSFEVLVAVMLIRARWSVERNCIVKFVPATEELEDLEENSITIYCSTKLIKSSVWSFRLCARHQAPVPLTILLLTYSAASSGADE